MLLAIDTATRYASLALYDGSGVMAEWSWYSENNHSVEVLPAIAAMLAQQGLYPDDLSAVAVAKGPGSFTGLRIGMSIAKGLCLALEIPIIAIPTLDVTTYAVGDPGGPIYAVLEVGRGRICVARYHFEQGLPVQEGEIELVSAAEWTPTDEDIDPLLVAGEVNAELAERLLSSEAEIAVSSLAGSLRRAGYLAELAWEAFQDERFDDVDALGPIYAHYPSSGTAG